ncbi:MAG: hypothetical protein ABI563_05365 [Specibacter sp.]
MVAAVSIIFLSFGFSGMNSWGVAMATQAAPFNVLGLSLALVLIVLGIIGGQAFFMWLRKQKSLGRPQIFDLDVLKSGAEKATTFCMAAMLFVGTACFWARLVCGHSSELPDSPVPPNCAGPLKLSNVHLDHSLHPLHLRGQLHGGPV